MTALYLLLRVLSLGCFVFDFGISKNVTRITALGLAFLAASMITW